MAVGYGIPCIKSLHTETTTNKQALEGFAQYINLHHRQI